MKSRLLCGLLAALVVLVPAACGSGAATGPGAVAVTGTAGAPPTLSFDAPVEVSGTSHQVVWPGDGPALTEGGPVLLHMYGEDGRDHGVLTNTYVDGPRSFTLDRSSLGAGMAAALKGEHVGARILFEEMDGDVPVVLVLDVLPTRAYGEEVDPVEGYPTVTDDADGAPTITIPADVTPAQELAVQPLVRGTGSQVEAGQTMTVRFTGVSWTTGEVVDTNWDDPASEPLTVTAGVGTLIEGWEQGLLEQTVGSRVILVVPPDLAYGGTDSPWAEDTLVYVVDILDAYTPTAAPSQEGS